MVHFKNTDYPNKYVAICIEPRCNNNCQHCLLKGANFRVMPFGTFLKILKQNFFCKYHSIVFSGAEVTLNKDLNKFVAYARNFEEIKHIRIQTNGRKLSDYSFCSSLVNYGVDEFFVSISGPNAKIHDSITRKNGSFRETFQGLENLSKKDILIIVNIVITSINFKLLPQIVRKISDFKNIKEVNFWGYFSRKVDRLIVSNQRIKPYLLEAIDLTLSSGRRVVIKYFPACLLGKYRKFLDNSQPNTLPFVKVDICNNCPSSIICNNKLCYGLTHAYMNKFGKDF